MSLEKLGADLDAQIDDLAEDPSAGGTSPVGEPTPAAAPKDPAEPATPAPSEKVKPYPLPDMSKKPAAAPADPKAASPEPAASPAAEPKAPDLSKYPESYRKMLAKFVPGGEIKTEADLQTAIDKAAEDYWRNQNRLAELAKDPKEPPSSPEPGKPPTAPEQPPTPKELQVYDQGLADLQTKGRHAIENIQGWTNEIGRLNQQIAELEARRSRGDATFDPEELVRAFQEKASAEAHLNNWNNHFAGLRNQNNDLLTRKAEAARVLEINERLSRQEQERQEREDREQQEGFRKEFDTTLPTAMAEAKVPEEYKAELQELAEMKVHQRAGQKAFGDGELKPFLVEVAKAFMRPIEKAAAKAREEYTTRKTDDAPKVPSSKKRVVKDDDGARYEAPSIRRLEQAIQDADLDG